MVHKAEGEELDPNDYVIEADDYGIPQSRHRVILFGIRSDVAEATPALTESPERFLLTKVKKKVGVSAALAGLPPLRSRLSKEPDSQEAWMKVLRDSPNSLKDWRAPLRSVIETTMEKFIKRAEKQDTYGSTFIPMDVAPGEAMPKALRDWYLDPKVGGVLQHETRSHMRSDLHRYMFAACFAGDLSADVVVVACRDLALGELAEDRPQHQRPVGDRIHLDRDFDGKAPSACRIDQRRKALTKSSRPSKQIYDGYRLIFLFHVRCRLASMRGPRFRCGYAILPGRGTGSGRRSARK